MHLVSYVTGYRLRHNVTKKYKMAREDTLKHAPVGSVCDGKYMWRHLMTLLALVQFYYLLRVNW